MFLTREAIFNADNTMPSEVVSVPEWGGDVKVVGLTGAEKDAFEESRQSGRGKNTKTNLIGIRAALVVASVRDEHNKPVFQYTDIAALSLKSGKALDRVVNVAMRLSGMTPDELEAIEKN